MSSIKKEIILVLQFFDENTTSTLRFQSLINEFTANKNYSVKVVIICYPIIFNKALGLEVNQKDNYQFNDLQIFKYYPKLNIIQKLGFYAINTKFRFLWKICQMATVMFYSKDNFHINYNDDLLNVKDLTIKNGFVIAFGGPFGLFSIASKMAKKFDYKLILDYRDPWTFGYTPHGGIKFLHRLKNKIEKKNELFLLSQTVAITTVSSSLKEFFPKNIQTKVKVIPNGSNFDDNEIIKITNIKKFNIVYAGTIYKEQLGDLTFFESFNIFLKGKNVNNISLQFVGSNNNPLLKNLLSKYNLLNVSTISKRVLRNDLLKILNESSVFLHLKYGDKRDIITSKQADYLAFRRPILLPMDDHGDLSESIRRNKAGYVCNNINENIQILNMLYLKFLQVENLFIEQPDNFIDSFSRKTIARNFVESVLEEVNVDT